MRFLGLLLLLAGLFAAFGENITGRPFGEFWIGRYNAMSPARNFAPIIVSTDKKDGPLGVSLEVAIRAGAYDAGGESELTMKVSDIDGQIADLVVPVSSKTGYRQEDGTLLLENVLVVDPVKTGKYTFLLGEGGRDDLGVSAILLDLKGHEGSVSFNVQPIGFAVAAVGGLMVLAGGRGRRKKSAGRKNAPASKTSSIGYRQPESGPEPKKRKRKIVWGRDGGADRS